MKEYDYAHQTNRPQPLSEAPRPAPQGRHLCTVYRKAEYNTYRERIERTQHRANGTWCSPIYRRRDGSKYYKLHHSGPMHGSTSEVENRRLAQCETNVYR